MYSVPIVSDPAKSAIVRLIMTAKKRWKKPELIVLVRGKPEEAVLAAFDSGNEKSIHNIEKPHFVYLRSFF